MLRVVWRVRVRSGDKRARRAVVAGGVRPDPTLALTLLLRNASTRGRLARLSANETAPRGIFSIKTANLVERYSMMTRSVSKTAGKRRPAPERFESEKALAELALMSDGHQVSAFAGKSA
jgi:hypothetical protein